MKKKALQIITFQLVPNKQLCCKAFVSWTFAPSNISSNCKLSIYYYSSIYVELLSMLANFLMNNFVLLTLFLIFINSSFNNILFFLFLPYVKRILVNIIIDCNYNLALSLQLQLQRDCNCNLVMPTAIPVR